MIIEDIKVFLEQNVSKTSKLISGWVVIMRALYSKPRFQVPFTELRLEGVYEGARQTPNEEMDAYQKTRYTYDPARSVVWREVCRYLRTYLRRGLLCWTSGGIRRFLKAYCFR